MQVVQARRALRQLQLEAATAAQEEAVKAERLPLVLAGAVAVAAATVAVAAVAQSTRLTVVQAAVAAVAA